MKGLKESNKSRDLLDMELETAERRIEELTANCRQLEDKVAAIGKEKELEKQLKCNAEQVIVVVLHQLLSLFALPPVSFRW